MEESLDGGEHCTSQMWGASARAHVHTLLQYLANGLEDCVEIWCVARDPFGESYMSQMWGQSACAHVYTPFARWCLRGHSLIADQGALLVYQVSQKMYNI